jgi:imidazolonepropionase
VWGCLRLAPINTYLFFTRGRSSEEATEYIVSEQIPAISQLCLSGDLHVDNIDVFCEKNVFNYQQSKRILTAGKKEGWAINFHGDELSLMHSGELAGELKAAAVSHLEEVSDRGIAAMVDSGTVGVLLPTTAYILHLTPPPARRMIDKGMAVALGSDFNPNAFCMSMPLVMHLACVMLGMTMEEALVASTINSAAALGLSRLRGSLEVGKKADILILTEDKWEHIIYQLGSVDRCIQYVIKDGRIIHESSR